MAGLKYKKYIVEDLIVSDEEKKKLRRIQRD